MSAVNGRCLSRYDSPRENDDCYCVCAKSVGHKGRHVCCCDERWTDKQAAPVPEEQPPAKPYPPNTMCVCGELIHPDQPFVFSQPDRTLWHGNADGGGHSSASPVPKEQP